MTETMTLRATSELKKILREVARERGLTVNALIVTVMWDYVKKEKQECFKGE